MAFPPLQPAIQADATSSRISTLSTVTVGGSPAAPDQPPGTSRLETAGRGPYGFVTALPNQAAPRVDTVLQGKEGSGRTVREGGLTTAEVRPPLPCPNSVRAKRARHCAPAADQPNSDWSHSGQNAWRSWSSPMRSVQPRSRPSSTRPHPEQQSRRRAFNAATNRARQSRSATRAD